MEGGAKVPSWVQNSKLGVSILPSKTPIGISGLLIQRPGCESQLCPSSSFLRVCTMEGSMWWLRCHDPVIHIGIGNLDQVLAPGFNLPHPQLLSEPEGISLSLSLCLPASLNK